MNKATLTALLVACAAVLPAHAQEKTKLSVALPPKEIIGTPVPIVWKNLDPTRPTAIPEILVPAGTTLLSKYKPVTSSDKTPILGELSFVTDGDKEASEGFEVELAPGVQWVQIDLQKTAEIHAIAVWHYHRQERAYKAVVVQISDDVEFKKGVTTVFNADVDNTAKQGAGKDKSYVETNVGKVIAANGVKGRYVRLYSAGNTSGSGNHYVEVEVHGK